MVVFASSSTDTKRVNYVVKKLLFLGLLIGLFSLFYFKQFLNEDREILGNITDNLSEITPVPSGIVPKKLPPQYVLLSFDGSESLAMWAATRNFAKEMNRQHKPLDFTYFISSVYFLPPNTKDVPSLIGYSRFINDIPKRIEQVKLAQSEGHEIASHLNGHFRSTDWSLTKWHSEFETFAKISPVKVVGFRSPLLSKNQYLYKILPQFGYKYDTSGVGKMGDWPTIDIYGTWEIPLVMINLPGLNKSTLSMDYNEYLAQTNAKDVLRRGTSAWNSALTQIVSANQKYFDYNYQGSRAPVVIGNHFSTWNDGVYWQAMKIFAGNVCGRPDVRCTTFANFVKFLSL